MDWDELRNKVPNLKGKGLWYGIAAVVVIWLLTGIYQVGPTRRGWCCGSAA